MMEAGFRPEKAATIDRNFASFEEALQHFLRVANIADAWTHFASIAQRDLPFSEVEPGP